MLSVVAAYEQALAAFGRDACARAQDAREAQYGPTWGRDEVDVGWVWGRLLAWGRPWTDGGPVRGRTAVDLGSIWSRRPGVYLLVLLFEASASCAGVPLARRRFAIRAATSASTHFNWKVREASSRSSPRLLPKIPRPEDTTLNLLGS